MCFSFRFLNDASRGPRRQGIGLHRAISSGPVVLPPSGTCAVVSGSRRSSAPDIPPCGVLAFCPLIQTLCSRLFGGCGWLLNQTTVGPLLKKSIELATSVCQVRRKNPFVRINTVPAVCTCRAVQDPCKSSSVVSVSFTAPSSRHSLPSTDTDWNKGNVQPLVTSSTINKEYQGIRKQRAQQETRRRGSTTRYHQPLDIRFIHHSPFNSIRRRLNLSLSYQPKPQGLSKGQGSCVNCVWPNLKHQSTLD
ncbi:hypothetical protein QBC45DRAFT_231497 [Copromyces sp. CBS 386.78]|nr:hypothetical protein QBC45DRAFT_231497 [Copromyces sp. CBS 386.78]